MVSNEARLRRELQEIGFTNRAIDAAWPEWWSSDAEMSVSATTELKFTLARRLGIAPTSLFQDRPRFAWRNEAKFKNLGTTTEDDRAILTSFGIAFGRAVLEATPPGDGPASLDALAIRRSILAKGRYVNFDSLLAASWSLGIPVVKINVHPLPNKYMHAMSVRVGDRYAILLGRDSRYPASAAFTLAHELGHIFLGHITGENALLDVEDPTKNPTPDVEERSADKYAMVMLTGQEELQVESSSTEFNAAQLAGAVVSVAAQTGIDPGVIALRLAYLTGRWQQAYGALNIIQGQRSREDVGRRANKFALGQFDWERVPEEGVQYLTKVMGEIDVH